MKAVKAGEYIGNDERTYRWGKNEVGRLWTEVWDESFPRWITASMDPEDWPAAKAALDALITEGDAEWVELNGYWRISTDGTKVQRRDWCDDSDPWVDTKDSPELVKLYRAGLTHGREVALAEHAALREQVKALVEAIEGAREWVHGVPCPWPDEWFPNKDDWKRIKEAAMRVQL